LNSEKNSKVFANSNFFEEFLRLLKERNKDGFTEIMPKNFFEFVKIFAHQGSSESIIQVKLSLRKNCFEKRFSKLDKAIFFE